MKKAPYGKKNLHCESDPQRREAKIKAPVTKFR
jgi:hypothetical protein